MTVAEAINCQELVELVTDYLEGALEPGDLRAVRGAFRRVAANAPTYMEQLRATIRAVGQITPEDLSPEAEAELLERISQLARSEQVS